MATVTIELTPARQAALQTLAAAAPLSAVITDSTSLQHAYVGWQQAHWLARQGLALRSGDHLHLTSRGRVLCGYAGIEVAEPDRPAQDITTNAEMGPSTVDDPADHEAISCAVHHGPLGESYQAAAAQA